MRAASASLALLALLFPSCSLVLDGQASQCRGDDDCRRLGFQGYRCEREARVCVDASPSPGESGSAGMYALANGGSTAPAGGRGGHAGAAANNEAGSAVGGSSPLSSSGARPTSEGGAGGAGGEVTGNAGAPACPSAVNQGFELLIYPEPPSGQLDATTDPHPFFEIVNQTGHLVAASRLKLRYYYTKEVTGPEVGTCFWLTGGENVADVSFDFRNSVPATRTADRFMEVSLARSTSQIGTTPFEVRTGFHTVTSELFTQTNDYSYDSDAAPLPSSGLFPYRASSKVTLYLDEQLIWGSEPCE